MSKHTPGPWEVVEHESSPMRPLIMAEKQSTLIAFANWPGMRSLAVLHANARLIAAAPELLQLIKDFRQWDQDYPKTTVHSKTGEMRLDLLFHRCIDIIAKAEG